VSIFTILSELKCVLEQRKPTYEYFVHAPHGAKEEEGQEEAQQQQKEE
jgi:hypothetical protein